MRHNTYHSAPIYAAIACNSQTTGISTARAHWNGELHVLHQSWSQVAVLAEQSPVFLLRQSCLFSLTGAPPEVTQVSVPGDTSPFPFTLAADGVWATGERGSGDRDTETNRERLRWTESGCRKRVRSDGTDPLSYWVTSSWVENGTAWIADEYFWSHAHEIIIF